MELGLPDGPRSPRAAQTLAFALRTGPFLDACAARHGDVFTLRLSGFLGTAVHVSRPDHVRAVFTADADVLSAGEGNEFLAPLVGPASVLVASGADHRRQRRVLLPAFHRERVAAFRDLVAELVHAEVDGWAAGRPLALRPRFQALTLDVMLRILFGLEPGSDGYRQHRGAVRSLVGEAFRAGPALMMFAARRGRLPQQRRARPWSAFLRAVDDVDALLYREIRRRRRAPGDVATPDVLSMLVQATDEDGMPLGDGEIRDQLVTLLLAGHETSATALAWAFDLLVHHPLAWDRLRGASEGDGSFARAVSCEALRLRPPLYGAGRRVLRPWSLAGWTIPAGASVTVSAYLAHRRPDVWEEPAAFRPERFLDAEPERYAWLPFGGGTRRCLGAELALMEMEVALAAIAGRVELRAASDAPEPVVRRNIVYMPRRDATVHVDAVSATPGPAAPASLR